MLNSIEFPFSADTFITQRRRLKRKLLTLNVKRQSIRVAILGGSTTSEIKNVLEVFLLIEGFLPEFYESDYNQFFEDIMFDNAELSDFKPNIIYFHTSYVNITTYPALDSTRAEVEAICQSEMIKYNHLWSKAYDKYGAIIIQNNFDLPIIRELGNLDSVTPQGKSYLIQRLNLEFSTAAQNNKYLHIQDINYLSARIGLDTWWDPAFFYSYKYAVSYAAIPHLAYNLNRIICAAYSKTKKCLVVDLDNTIWGGVIGDEGVNNIEIGVDTAQSEAYTALQSYILQLKKRGIAIAVCSKNEEKNAKEGLLHPDSVLKIDDFTVFKANWKTKSENLLDIANELNIGLDSLVFLDDSSREREIIRQQLPEVSVLDVGEGIENFLSILDQSGFFEVTSLQKEDVKRTQYYQENFKRGKFERNFEDYSVYLHSLEMFAEIQPFIPVYFERITQLINKTNQFNLTTRRSNYSDVVRYQQSGNFINLYGRLKDKFGDNGVISVIVGELKSKESHIVLWLMSCRVFKRDFEFAIFDKFVAECQLRQVKRIIGYYSPTEKNHIVENLYSNLGFEFSHIVENTKVWVFVIPDDYQLKNKHIKVSL